MRKAVQYYTTERPAVVGFDTETVKGKVVLVTCSNGAWLEPKSAVDLLAFLYQNVPKDGVGFFYNINFDFSVIARKVVEEGGNADELRYLKELNYKGFTIKYINGKGFEINRSRHGFRKFFDISQFFADGNGKHSLDTVARAWLGEGKMEMDREALGDSEEFYQANRMKVIEYSIHDSRLAARLGEKFLDLVYDLFHIYPTRFYSQASVAKAWVAKVHPELVRIAKTIPYFARNAAWHAYRGGIFLVRILGKVDEASEIDINSAYPYALSQLPDLRNLSWHQGAGYHKGVYSFHYVDVKHDGFIPYRTGKNYIIYPESNDYIPLWLTGIEVDYLISKGLTSPEKVRYSVWATGAAGKAFPEIPSLYAMRLRYKKKAKEGDKAAEAAQWGIKIVMNSIYGVLAQSRPGITRFTNMVYAAYITAMTRRKIWELADKVGRENIISIQTDALVFKGGRVRGIKESNDLGDVKYEFESQEVITYMNGLAIRAGELKKRGFPTLTKEMLLSAKGDTLSVRREKPVRLLEGLVKKTVDKIGAWVEEEKVIDLKANLLKGEVDPELLKFEILNTREVPLYPLKVYKPEKMKIHYRSLELR